MVDPGRVGGEGYLDVVVGEAVEQAGGLAVFEEYGAYLAEVTAVEGAALLFAQDAQHLVAAAALGEGDGPVHFGGGRIGALAVGEHVEVADVELLDEAIGFQEILFRLAGEADDQIDPDTTVGHDATDVGHPLGVELAAVAAAHTGQLLVVAALQRHVKVGRKAPASGHEVEDLIGAQVGLDAGDPEAGDAFHFVERPGQVDK